MPQKILALDQGTTSSRAMVFDHGGQTLAVGQEEFTQILPSPGHVEHDPEEIWNSQLRSMRQAVEQSGGAGEGDSEIAAIGVTNQRETTLIWEKATGKPVANAIVWQSRITSGICERLKRDGVEPLVREKTGLLLDPYFSGTKVRYLLDQIPNGQARAERGELLFGTVDSFLIWRLTKARTHVTDASNASRTLLFNLHTQAWDDELLKIMGVPRAMLPEVVTSSGVIGTADAEWLGREIPIAGIAGDQQAATFGQTCFRAGEAKSTYGTGCFLLMNTGDKPLASNNRLLTTVGWSINGKATYCLEGAVFIGGAIVQWLRDGLGLIKNAADVEALAAQVPDADGVILVPALTGLGAPYWDPHARGTIVGITRGTTAAHLARAALDAVAWQVSELIHAMEQDAGVQLGALRIDGGASRNNLLAQIQSDYLGAVVERPTVTETTALGAAYLAGLGVGFWSDLDDLRKHWKLDRRFEPKMDAAARKTQFAQWKRAVERSLNWNQP
jgi:glycerol kinase